MTGVIALHIGAGLHSMSLRKDYKALMKNACQQGIEKLLEGGSSVDAVLVATKILENSSLTNAGFGSCLSQNGTVECDASIMDGRNLVHGAVGCVSGVKNPIELSKGIMEAQSIPLPGGLVPPSLICGDGAYSWAVLNGIEVCPPEELISESSKKIHSRSIKYLNSISSKRKSTPDNSSENLKQQRLDTVGVVCVDKSGNVASSVSSGGLLLKQPGRVGQAATYGCGCWAENNCDGSDVNVCVSSSGCGEHLVRTMFAHMCAKSVVKTDPLGIYLTKCIKDDFLHSKFLRDIETPMCGALILKYIGKESDLFWLHSTSTMGVAYMTTNDAMPQAHFSELNCEQVGKTINLFCKSFPNIDEPDLQTRKNVDTNYILTPARSQAHS